MADDKCEHVCGVTAPDTIIPVPFAEGRYEFSHPDTNLNVDLRGFSGTACSADFDDNNNSEDFRDYTVSPPAAVVLDPCTQGVLNNCLANLDWFSSRYGTGYGRLEVIGHIGVSRFDFRFSRVVAGKTVTLYESDVRQRLRDSVSQAQNNANGDTSTTIVYPDTDFIDDTAVPVPGRSRGNSTAVYPKRVTARQLEWLRQVDLYGSTFRVNRSWHYHDRAIDIAWIGWNDATLERPIQRRAARPCRGRSDVQSGTAAYRRMVAVEACLRKYFGTVLNRNHDSAHWNHFHVDDGPCVGLNLGKSSHVKFIKDCVEAFTDVRLSGDEDQLGVHDGGYDDKARDGYMTLMSDLGMERLAPETYSSHYWLFLNYIMMHGFANERAGHYRYGDFAAAPVA
ncbi:extensin family protein [Candidatus Poriferisodalis sp.]|uniref:extensin family protein n=1 Tax=Candidatus Poriferisodalis sp. TaxID=3101277 RepID=UPI003B02A0B2